MPTRTLLFATLLGTAAAAHAADVVTWVDADGVTHFGNAQLAPTDARAVELAATNGMDVPTAPPASRRSRGPRTVVLDKPLNREPIGWRGHQWNVQRRGHR